MQVDRFGQCHPERRETAKASSYLLRYRPPTETLSFSTGTIYLSADDPENTAPACLPVRSRYAWEGRTMSKDFPGLGWAGLGLMPSVTNSYR